MFEKRVGDWQKWSEKRRKKKTSSDNLKPLREVVQTSAELLPNSVDHPFHSLPLVPFGCHRILYFCFRLSSPLLPLIYLFVLFGEWCWWELWLRTEEGHHLVTGCLHQMPLEENLVVFGTSRVNKC